MSNAHEAIACPCGGAAEAGRAGLRPLQSIKDVAIVFEVAVLIPRQRHAFCIVAEVSQSQIAMTDPLTDFDTTRGPLAARDHGGVPKSEAHEPPAAETKSPVEDAAREQPVWPAIVIFFAIFTVIVWGAGLVWLVWVFSQMVFP